jgi:hypothetical protein
MPRLFNNNHRKYIVLFYISFVAVLASANATAQQRGSPDNNYLRRDGNQIEFKGSLSTSPEELKRMGISSHELGTVISVMRRIGSFGHGGFGYKCDSETNKCTCNNNDPLDCILLIDECLPHPPGRPDQVCGSGSPTCECDWH